jgi:hypothetical protein
MREPFGEITLVKVIRPYTILHKLVNQRLDNSLAVVDACQEYRLVAQGNACIC